MSDQIQSNLVLLAISLTVIVTVAMGSGFSTSWDTVVGLVLAACLWNFRTRPLDHRVIFPLALIWGFCSLIVLGVVIDSIYVFFEKEILTFTNNQFGPRAEQLFQPGKPLWARHVIAGVIWFFASMIAYPFVKKLSTDNLNKAEESN